MTNYLETLPHEIIDNIFYYCSLSCFDDETTYVCYIYELNRHHESCIRKIYKEYTGNMLDGKPNGVGSMYSGTQYIDNHHDSDHHDSDHHDAIVTLTTIWLHKDFLYTIKNFNKFYTLQYLQM